MDCWSAGTCSCCSLTLLMTDPSKCQTDKIFWLLSSSFLHLYLLLHYGLSFSVLLVTDAWFVTLAFSHRTGLVAKMYCMLYIIWNNEYMTQYIYDGPPLSARVAVLLGAVSWSSLCAVSRVSIVADPGPVETSAPHTPGHRDMGKFKGWVEM